MRSGRLQAELTVPGLTLLPSAAFAADGDVVPGLGEMALRAGLSLAAVLALIVALALLIRRLRAPRLAGGAPRRLIPLDRLDLGARREIRLLRFENRLLLVGVTGDRIALLSDVTAAVDAAPGEAEAASGLQVLRELTSSS